MIDENGNKVILKLLPNGQIDMKSGASITPANPDTKIPDSYQIFRPVVSTTSDCRRRRSDPTIEEGPPEPSREEEVVSTTDPTRDEQSRASITPADDKPGKTPAPTIIGRTSSGETFSI